MAVRGQLSNFSLPEVLQFVEEGNKTGLLTIRSLPNTTESFQTHFIWLDQGRIIAAADCNTYHGLSRLIAHHHWLSRTKLLRLIQQCPLHTPFGTYLKTQKVLTIQQLKILFSEQIIREICALFMLSDGSFDLISNIRLPYLEMTGMNISATAVTLPGLRRLRNWSALEDKLPNPTSALLSSTDKEPQLPLTGQEKRAWKFADGSTSLNEIAQRLDSSIDTIRRIAFRLTISGLVEEVPIIALNLKADKGASLPGSESPNLPSPEFLSQMLHFLNKQS